MFESMIFVFEMFFFSFFLFGFILCQMEEKGFIFIFYLCPSSGVVY